MKTLRVTVQICALLCGLALVAGAASAAPLTLSGSMLFSSLDGSAQDSDGLANGVFTVSGDLVIDGTISCNDDLPLGTGASACPIRISVSGDLTLEAGSGIFAENRRGNGNGGNVRLDVGGDLTLLGPDASLPGAIVSTSRTTGTVGTAGSLTAEVAGTVDLQAGSVLAASSLGGNAGAISVTGETVSVAGLIASGGSRTVLSSRFSGDALGSGNSGQSGGTIHLRALGATEPGLSIQPEATVVSQGEGGGGRLVLLDACGIEVRGLVASLSRNNGPSQVALRSGKGILVDGRDLGSATPAAGRFGRVRADGTQQGAAGYLVDLFAASQIQVLGSSTTGLFAVSSAPGNQPLRNAGGTITAISLDGTLNATGNAFETGRDIQGDKGGVIDLQARGDVTLDGAKLRAVGGFTSTLSTNVRAGGHIDVRSFQGAVSWTFGAGDVRPTGTGVPAARRGTIGITACSTVGCTGTQFPVSGSAVPPFPVEDEGVCSPAAPSLPAGEPPLPVCAPPNEPPAPSGGPFSIAENSANGTVVGTVSANDPDAGQTHTFSILAGNTGGAFTIGSSTGQITVADSTALDFETTPSFSLTVQATDDGAPAQSGTGTVVVNLTDANDRPTITGIANQTIDEDTSTAALAFTIGDAETAAGTLTVSGTSADTTRIPNANIVFGGSGANRTVTVTPAPNQFGGPVAITITVNDGPGAPTPTNSTTSHVTLNAVNDQPTVTGITNQTIDEDTATGALAFTVGDTETAPGSITVSAISSDQTLIPNANIVFGGSGANRTVTVTPAANQSGGPVTITITINDGSGAPNATNSTMFTVTVNAVNDQPTITGITDQTIDEDTSTAALAFTIGDIETAAGSLTVSGTSSDQTRIPNANIAFGGSGANRTVTVTPALDQFGGPVTITITVNDGSGAPNATNSTTFTVTVNSVNDQPTITGIANQTIDEDTSTGVLAFTIGDIETAAGSLTVSGSSSNTTIIPNGNVVFGGSGANRTVTVNPAPNQFGGPVTITITVNDGSGQPNATNSTVFTVTVNPVNDPPSLADTTLDYTVLGNTQLRVGETTTGNSVLHLRDNQDLLEKSGPTDIDGPLPFDVVVIANPTNGQLSPNGDGTFRYEPNAGFEGTDSFQVRVRDAAGAQSVPVTVSLNVSQMVWYVRDVVDGDNPADGDDGRSTNAFEVLSDVEPVVTDNDFIFVFEGTTSTTPLDGGIDIDNTGVKLHGQGVGLTVPGFGELIPAGNRPRITNSGAAGAPEDNGVNVIATAASLTGIEIRGLDISGRDNAIDVTATGANTASVDIRDNVVSGAGLEGIDVNAGSTGTVTLAIRGNTLTAMGAAIDIQRTAGTVYIRDFGNNVVSGNTGGTGINILGAIFDAAPGGSFDPVNGNVTVIGAPGNGVGQSGMVLTSVQGNLSFSDLDIFADSGAGLRVSGAGSGMTFGVLPGVGIIEATGGPAVDAASLALSLPLSSIKSTNSPTTGLALNSVTGTFSAEAGSSISNITSASGTAFQVGSSNAAITYKGTISTTQGKGVDLTGNTGSTIDLQGTLTLSTGTNTAFNVTGGGTVTATNTSSTLTSTTGTALNVASTTIGAGGLKFRSISSNGGGGSGIVLNNTGSSGGLAVGGNGGSCTSAATCTGGAIQNKTVDGISLNNTRGVSLTRMFIDNNDGSGIFGDDVTDFSLINSMVSNSGDTQNGSEAGLRFNELLGNCAITNSTITGSSEDNIRMTPASGVLTNLAISGSTISSCAAPVACNGLVLIATGTADLTFNVTGTTFSSNKSSAFLISMSNTSKGTVNVSGNTFSDNTLGVDLSNALSADLTFDIDTNTFLRHANNAVNIISGTTATNAAQLTGRVRNNIIGDNNSNSGSRDAFGIAIDADGDVDAVISVTNNTIKHTDFEGIFAESAFDDDADAETGKLDLTLTGNNVGAPDDNSAFPIGAIYGVRLESRRTTSLCLDISGNTAASTGGLAHFRIRQRDASTYKLERFVGDGTNDSVIASFIAAQNAGGSTASATHATTYTGVANGACRKP